MKHKDEYHARLWYEENRWRHKPRIWFIKPLPIAFVWDDVTVDYLVVRGEPYIIRRQKYFGRPRYCEWGADISKVEVVVKNFQREELCWHSVYPHFTYKFPVYIQSSLDLDVKRKTHSKAQSLASRRLLRFKN